MNKLSIWMCNSIVISQLIYRIDNTYSASYRCLNPCSNFLRLNTISIVFVKFVIQGWQAIIFSKSNTMIGQ